MPDAQWFFSDELDDDQYDIEHAIAPIGKGDTVTPLALPVTRGDRITIEIAEDAVAKDIDGDHYDHPRAGETEVYHFGGLYEDSVALIDPDDHEYALEQAEDGGFATIYSSIREGIWSFNTLIQKHAERVEVERVEVPPSYRVR